MNLTYEILQNGYIILKDGIPWIKQENYILFPSDTIEKSAQLHIDDIIKNNQQIQGNSIEERLQALEIAMASQLGGVV